MVIYKSKATLNISKEWFAIYLNICQRRSNTIYEIITRIKYILILVDRRQFKQLFYYTYDLRQDMQTI